MISYELMDRLLESCNDSEISLILYACQYQDDYGLVEHLDYKTVCLKLDITKQTFYNALYSLEQKKIIWIDWRNNNSEWRFIILDNNFKHLKRKYIPVNKYPFLFDLEFFRSKLGIKKLMFKLLKTQWTGKSFTIGMDALKKWADTKSNKLINEYVKFIKKYFYITYSKDRNNKEVLQLKLIEVVQWINDKGIIKMFYHKVVNICKRFRISYSGPDLKSLCIMFFTQQEYRSRIIMAFLDTSIKKNSIEPALINYLTNRNTYERYSNFYETCVK